MNIEKKLAALEKEIVTQAQDECKRISADYELKKDEAVAKQELALLTDMYNAIQKEKRNAAKEKNNRILAFSSEGKKKLAAAREKMIDDIFAEVIRRVKAFRESGAYFDYLKKSVDAALFNFSGEPLSLTLSKDDQKYAELLKSYSPGISAVELTGDEIIGGLIAAAEKSGRIYDGTLKSAIAAERRNFLRNSKLTI